MEQRYKRTKTANIHIRLEELRKEIIGRKAMELGVSSSELLRLIIEREFPLIDEAPSVAK